MNLCDYGYVPTEAEVASYLGDSYSSTFATSGRLVSHEEWELASVASNLSLDGCSVFTPNLKLKSGQVLDLTNNYLFTDGVDAEILDGAPAVIKGGNVVVRGHGGVYINNAIVEDTRFNIQSVTCNQGDCELISSWVSILNSRFDHSKTTISTDGVLILEGNHFERYLPRVAHAGGDGQVWVRDNHLLTYSHVDESAMEIGVWGTLVTPEVSNNVVEYSPPSPRSDPKTVGIRLYSESLDPAELSGNQFIAPQSENLDDGYALCVQGSIIESGAFREGLCGIGIDSPFFGPAMDKVVEEGFKADRYRGVYITEEIIKYGGNLRGEFSLVNHGSLEVIPDEKGVPTKIGYSGFQVGENSSFAVDGAIFQRSVVIKPAAKQTDDLGMEWDESIVRIRAVFEDNAIVRSYKCEPKELRTYQTEDGLVSYEYGPDCIVDLRYSTWLDGGPKLTDSADAQSHPAGSICGQAWVFPYYEISRPNVEVSGYYKPRNCWAKAKSLAETINDVVGYMCEAGDDDPACISIDVYMGCLGDVKKTAIELFNTQSVGKYSVSPIASPKDDYYDIFTEDEDAANGEIGHFIEFGVDVAVEGAAGYWRAPGVFAFLEADALQHATEQAMIYKIGSELFGMAGKCTARMDKATAALGGG